MRGPTRWNDQRAFDVQKWPTRSQSVAVVLRGRRTDVVGIFSIDHR